MSIILTIVFLLKAKVGNSRTFALVKRHLILFKKNSYWQYLIIMQLFS